jgi:hypothetical protein
VPGDSYVGMIEGSWAYHADDGELYVKALGQESGNSNSRDTEEFGEGDIVGCGLNMETGEGYRTFNGKRLDSGEYCTPYFPQDANFDRVIGNAFDDHKFKKGKIYPCVGFRNDKDGNGLHVRVVLKQSKEHKFMYKGPDI